MRQNEQALALVTLDRAPIAKRKVVSEVWSAKKAAVLACLFLAFSSGLVMQRNTINNLDAGIQKLESDLAGLQKSNDDLKGAIMKGADLEAAERYAQSHGMIKATPADQISSSAMKAAEYNK